MIVKKFDDFIDEGLWSKTFDRARTGEERGEDKILSNIDKLKGIDLGLPFLISDDFFKTNEEEVISFDEYNQTYRNFIERKGWRLPHRDDIKKICHMIHDADIVVDRKITMGGDKMFTYVSQRRKPDDVITFELTTDYKYIWLDYSPKDSEKSRENTIGELWTWWSEYPERSTGFKKRKQLIRLIKDKSVHEGLWSKTFDRARTGDVRKEEHPFIKYIQNINWIDLGHPNLLFAETDFDEELLSLEEILDLKDKFPKGVDIVDRDVYNWINSNCNIVNTNRSTNSFKITSKDNKNIYMTLSGGGEPYIHYSSKSMGNINDSDVLTEVCSITSFNKCQISISYCRSKVSHKKFKIKLSKQKINEGLWSKTFDRARTGDFRKEDKLPPNNLKDLVPVDLGLSFLIADKPFFVEKEQFFKLEDVENYIYSIEKTGWRLPTRTEVEELQKFKNCQYSDETASGKVIFTSNDGNTSLIFNATIHDFYVKSPEWKFDNGISCAMFNESEPERNYIRSCAYMDSYYYTIRLVRDKK